MAKKVPRLTVFDKLQCIRNFKYNTDGFIENVSGIFYLPKLLMAKKIWFFSQASLHEGHAMTSDNPERIRNVLK